MSKSPILSFLASNALIVRNQDGSIDEQRTGEALIMAVRAELASAAERYARIEAFLDTEFDALALTGKTHKGASELAFALACTTPGAVFSEIESDLAEFVAQSPRFASERGRGKGVTRLAKR